ncbi:MAG: hypothetical protein ABI707_10780 [Ferruginibacter sp.]
MKTVATFLLKVFVKQFYIINAGFLLFIFFVFFGMVHGGQLIAYHRSLILAILSSPVFLAMVLAAWTLYNLKCILFCTNTIKAADSNYIYTLRAMSRPGQWIAYLLISTLQYMPVLAYSFFVMYMALNRALLFIAVLVTAWQLLMVALGAAMIFISINKNRIAPMTEKIFSTVTTWKLIKHSYGAFLLGNILYEKKMAFAIVKIFSILLLSVSFLRNGDNFDEDLFSIFFQVIFVAHAILVFYCIDFAESMMQFSRNLPVALHKVAGMYLFTYAIILLPDAAFMLINNHGNLPLTEILVLYGIAVSTLFLYTAIGYGCGLNMDNYMLLVFIFFLMIFFLQKTGLQLLTMLVILLTATIVFKKSYYNFEKQ